MTTNGSLRPTTTSLDNDWNHRRSPDRASRESGAQPTPEPMAAGPDGTGKVLRDQFPGLVGSLDILAKAVLVVMLGTALIYPDLGHMEDKASGLRAITYPMLAFALPATWFLCGRRDRSPFPWACDLMVTMTLFTDILGNRMNLFDTVEWFDDWVHVLNPGLLTAAVLLLTVPPTFGFGALLERALAFGMTAAVAWEIAEYAAFISRSTEKQSAYSDTLSDLALGALGAVAAAVIIHTCRVAGSGPPTMPGSSSACGDSPPQVTAHGSPLLIEQDPEHWYPPTYTPPTGGDDTRPP